MITLTRTVPVLGGTVSVNTARCTWASPTISILSAVAASWLLRSVIPVLPSETNVVTITITNPGTAAISLSASCHVFAAAGSLIGSTYGATVTIAAGDSYTWALTSATSPAAVDMRVDVSLAATSGTGWLARVDTMTSTVTATADEVLAAPLSRPLRRTADDVLDSADYRIVAGTPGRLRGTITYLCSTLAAARAVDTIYQGAPAVILSDAGNPLDGLKHLAVGEIRYGAERTVPGVPARWTLTADIREVA